MNSFFVGAFFTTIVVVFGNGAEQTLETKNTMEFSKQDDCYNWFNAESVRHAEMNMHPQLQVKFEPIEPLCNQQPLKG